MQSQSKIVIALATKLFELSSEHANAAEAETACSIAQKLAALRKESSALLRVQVEPLPE
jgi:hypothetical protein